MVTIKNTQRSVKINVAKIRVLVKKVLKKLGYEDFDIGIWFTTNKTIQKYNKRYRTINKPTDILSFAYHPTIKPGTTIIALTPEDKNLGDLIISAEYVKKVAQESAPNFNSSKSLKHSKRKANTDFEEHLAAVIIHGICHLIGYTHKNDAEHQKMITLEKELLKSARK